ncbi:TPA: hypothetical protein I7735_20945 [Vibrio vulnificus]|nr:hypothetical protein D8T44_20545 [Vibrio vulnificus]HAS8393868.1 hypothetical protein [Vibrio vulnificus]
MLLRTGSFPFPCYHKYSILCRGYNAQLRGEQRYHPNLKHCTVNTKFEVEAKVPSVVNPS